MLPTNKNFLENHIELFLREFVSAPRHAVKLKNFGCGFVLEKAECVDSLHAVEFVKAKGDLYDEALYDESRKLLLIIAHAEKTGAVSDVKKKCLEEMLEPSGVSKLIVTFFSSKNEFSEVADQIAWGTKVWIASEPEHMIHYDDKPVMQAR